MKNTGLGKLPFFDFDANRAWALLIAVLGMNLVSWMQLVALPTGHAGRGWDIKRWRHRLFVSFSRSFGHQWKPTLSSTATQNPGYVPAICCTSILLLTATPRGQLTLSYPCVATYSA